MSDNDFDKLFRQKFDEFEVEASENVWEGISNTLNKERKGKNDRRFVLRAAASIVLVAAAALWLTPRKEKVWLHSDRPVSEALAEQSNVEEPVLGSTERTAMNSTKVIRNKASGPRIASVRSVKVPGTKSAHSVREKEQPVEKTHTFPDEIGDRTLVAVSAPPENVIQPVEVNKPLAMLVDESPIDENPENKSGIKSIGTLVNFVVGKVDKRKNKIIEFKDTDEGSLVSGINLGIVKIKTYN